VAPTNTSFQDYVDYLKTGYWMYSQGRDYKLPDLDVAVDLRGLEDNPAQLAAARLAMQQWSAVVPVTFHEVTAGADIIFENIAPGAFFTQGSKLLNVGQTFWGGNFEPGGYGFQVFLHEIGHALGLGHGGPYNTGGYYWTDAIFTKDVWPFSVMSYFSGQDAGLGSPAYATSPMGADIAAILQKYLPRGAVVAMNTGDDIYGFGGREGFRFGPDGLASNAGFTIHDTGGHDILDLSGSLYGCRIDVRPGSFSSVNARGYNIYIYPGADPSPIEEVRGSNSDDRITGSAGANTLLGNGGNDVLRGEAGGDRLDGGAGLDQASYETSAAGVTIDLLLGTGTGGDAAGDVLSGIEIVIGSRHADRLTGTAERDALHGGDGDDILIDGAGHDRLTGGIGQDRIEGGGGNDSIDGGIGDDILAGGADHDTIFGGYGADTIDGGDGSDVLEGSAGADFLRGGAGSDTATYAATAAGVIVDLSTGLGSGGVAAGDRLEGIERILGSAYDDVLTGDAGANTLTGNNGYDVLRGNAGADILTGGGHGDRFVYAAASDSTVGAGRDTIVGFWSGEGDKIDLRLIDADGKAANGDTAFVFGTGSFTGAGAELRVVQTSTLRVFQVQADIDGNRIPDFAILVSIVQDLGAAEFML
jgi:Ca2+-binding RTX toxin-like protein